MQKSPTLERHQVNHDVRILERIVACLSYSTKNVHCSQILKGLSVFSYSTIHMLAYVRLGLGLFSARMPHHAHHVVHRAGR